MKIDDDFINEDTIKDLIQYAEDEDSNTFSEEEPPQEVQIDDEPPEEELTEPPREKNVPERNIADYTSDGYYDGDEDKLIFTENKKNTKKGVIIGVVIGIAAIIVFMTVDSGIMGNYKNNFSNNFSKIFANFKSDKQQIIEQTPQPDAQYNTEIENSAVISFEDAGSTEFSIYREGIVCANMNHMTFIDASGAVVWEMDTAIVNPILKAEGNYILLAEKGGNKICLYSDNRLVYDVDDPDIIMTANVSSNGDVIAVTDKSSYKGGVSVYNKTGAQIFSWASGSDSVISADISAASRRVAVSLLNTDNTVGSIIQLFDINKSESYAKLNIDDTVIFDIKFTGNILNAFGDNRIAGISESGKLIYDNGFDASLQLTHSAMDGKGNKLISCDDNNIPVIFMYNKSGSLKYGKNLLGVADFIDINQKNIIYNIGRDIYFGKINAKTMSKYTASMDIKNLFIVSDDAFMIVYSNSLELVTI